MFIFFAFCTGTLSCAHLISVDFGHGMESSLSHWGRNGSFIKNWGVPAAVTLLMV